MYKRTPHLHPAVVPPRLTPAKSRTTTDGTGPAGEPLLSCLGHSASLLNPGRRDCASVSLRVDELLRARLLETYTAVFRQTPWSNTSVQWALGKAVAVRNSHHADMSAIRRNDFEWATLRPPSLGKNVDVCQWHRHLDR